jgi:hypothetical protein
MKPNDACSGISRLSISHLSKRFLFVWLLLLVGGIVVLTFASRGSRESASVGSTRHSRALSASLFPCEIRDAT